MVSVRSSLTLKPLDLVSAGSTKMLHCLLCNIHSKHAFVQALEDFRYIGRFLPLEIMISNVSVLVFRNCKMLTYLRCCWFGRKDFSLKEYVVFCFEWTKVKICCPGRKVFILSIDER